MSWIKLQQNGFCVNRPNKTIDVVGYRCDSISNAIKELRLLDKFLELRHKDSHQGLAIDLVASRQHLIEGRPRRRGRGLIFRPSAGNKQDTAKLFVK